MSIPPSVQVDNREAHIGTQVVAERVFYGGKEPARPECEALRGEISQRFAEAVERGELSLDASMGIGKALERLLGARGKWLEVPGCRLASVEVEDDDREDLHLPLVLLPPKGAEPVLVRCALAKTETAPEGPHSYPEGGRIVLATADAGGPVPDEALRQTMHEVCRTGLHLASGSEHDRKRGAFDPELDHLPHISLAALRQALGPRDGRPGAAVLQLVCHVREQGLCLHDDDSEQEVVVGAEALAAVLGPFVSHLRLVVLVPLADGPKGDPKRTLVDVAMALHRRGMAAVVAPRVPLPCAAATGLTAELFGTLLGDAEVAPRSLELALVCANGYLSTKDRLARLGLRLWARAADGHDTRPLVIRPYRGLLSFEPEHARFYSGRTDEVTQVVERLAQLREEGQPRLVMLVGASGVGKSSLAKAGVVPALAKDGWAAIFTRPAEHSGDQLEVLVEEKASERRLLVVDQLEEANTKPGSRGEIAAYLQRLWVLAKRDDVSVVATVRVDALDYGGTTREDLEHRRFLERVVSGPHAIFVYPLERDALHRAIVEPARHVGMQLDDGLADRLCAEVLAEPGALPMLELVLDQLWRERDGLRLVAGAYGGGLAGTLAAHANACIDALSEAQQRQAKRILVRIATGHVVELSTWRRRSIVRVLRPTCIDDRVAFDEALAALVDARLVVRGGASRRTRGAPLVPSVEESVELAHELLLRRWEDLRTWIDDAAPRLLAIRDLEHWVEERRRRGTLLTFDQLAHIDQSRLVDDDDDLDEEMRDLLEASRANVRRRKRIRQASFAGIGATAIVLAVLSCWALEQRAEAIERARDEMDARASLLANVPGRALEALELGILATDPIDEGAHGYRGLHDALTRAHRSTLLVGHAGPVLALGWDPTGSRIASVGADGTTRIWDPWSAKQLASHLREDPLTRAEWSPDGTRVAVATATGDVEIWDDALAARHQRRRLGGPISALAWSVDGERLAAATVSGEVWIETPDHRDASLQQRTPVGAVHAISWSNDGNSVLLLDDDGSVYDLDAWRGSLTSVSGSRDGRVTSAAWSTDGRRIAIGSKAGVVQILASDGGPVLIETLGHHRTGVRELAWNSDASRLAVVSSSGSMEVWDANTGAILVATSSAQMSSNALAWSPDGKRLAVAGVDGNTRILNDQGSDAVILGRHPADVRSLAWSPDGARLAVGSDDGSIRVWSTVPVEPRVLLEGGHEATIAAAAWAPDGSRVATASDDGRVLVWRSISGRSDLELLGHTGPVETLAWDAKGSRLATGGEDRHLRVFDSTTGALVHELAGHQGTIASVAWSPSGSRIASAAWDGTVGLWDPSKGALGAFLHADQGGGSGTASIAWSPDGNRLATSSLLGGIRLWEPATGKLLAELVGRGGTSCVAWSHDGRLLVTGHANGEVSAWDAVDGRLLWNQEVLDEAVEDVQWATTDRLIAVGGEQGSVMVVHAMNGAQHSKLQGHADRITVLAWSPTGRWLASASEDGVAKLWDPIGPHEVAAFEAHERGLLVLEWSPDGRRLLTAGVDDVVAIWTADPLAWPRRGCAVLIDAHRPEPIAEPTRRACALIEHSQGGGTR